MVKDIDRLVRTLSVEDRRAASRALSHLPIAGHARSLGYLLTAWNRLVTEIERAYDDVIYEYLNDVSVRDILGHVLDAVPPETADHLAAFLKPLDERFTVATVPIDRYLGAGIIYLDKLPRVRDRPEFAGRWWYTRIPRAPGPQLAADLKELGLLGEPSQTIKP